MSDPIRRALRTWLQVFSGLLIASPAFQALNSGELDVVGLKKLALAAFGATVTSLISFGQNALEDKTGTAFLIQKATPDPEPTQNPETVLGTPAALERPKRKVRVIHRVKPPSRRT